MISGHELKEFAVVIWGLGSIVIAVAVISYTAGYIRRSAEYAAKVADLRVQLRAAKGAAPAHPPIVIVPGVRDDTYTISYID